MGAPRVQKRHRCITVGDAILNPGGPPGARSVTHTHIRICIGYTMSTRSINADKLR